MKRVIGSGNRRSRREKRSGATDDWITRGSRLGRLVPSRQGDSRHRRVRRSDVSEIHLRDLRDRARGGGAPHRQPFDSATVGIAVIERDERTLHLEAYRAHKSQCDPDLRPNGSRPAG